MEKTFNIRLTALQLRTLGSALLLALHRTEDLERRGRLPRETAQATLEKILALDACIAGQARDQLGSENPDGSENEPSENGPFAALTLDECDSVLALAGIGASFLQHGARGADAVYGVYLPTGAVDPAQAKAAFEHAHELIEQVSRG